MDTRRPSEYILPDYGAKKYHPKCGKVNMTQSNIYNRYHRQITETEITGNASVITLFRKGEYKSFDKIVRSIHHPKCATPTLQSFQFILLNKADHHRIKILYKYVRDFMRSMAIHIGATMEYLLFL